MKTTPYISFKDINKEIIELGGKGIFKCYQCGSCTATCAIAEGMFISFRRVIKYAQLGFVDKLQKDLVPWLCNVHGDCIEACPRDANPCEILASLRRYQSTLYDWTGISKWWYFSSLKKKLLVTFILSMISIVGLLSIFYSSIMNYLSKNVFVNLPEILPIGILLTVLSLGLLASNGYRMYKFVGGGKDYVISFFESFKRVLRFWIKSENDALKISDKRIRILEHMFILAGIILYILLVLIYLIYPAIYSIYPFAYVIMASRYVAALLLVVGAGLPFVKRLSNSPKIHWYYKMFRHSTDWISLGYVFVIGLTGLLMNIFNDLNVYFMSYVIYVLHIGVVFPFLLLEVPFGKHNHWLYKSIANYVSARKGFIRGEILE
ncbi:MAG: 4Fe-4S dicluster domain-containing protein [Halobacteria archaeon]